MYKTIQIFTLILCCFSYVHSMVVILPSTWILTKNHSDISLRCETGDLRVDQHTAISFVIDGVVVYNSAMPEQIGKFGLAFSSLYKDWAYFRQRTLAGL